MKYLGSEWTSFVSESSGATGSLKEYYGFIWKSGEIRIAHSLGYFKDPNNLFATKPYGAEFITSNSDFTLILVHLSQNVVSETRHLTDVYDYFLGLVAAGNLILGGDFDHASSDQLDTFREVESLADAASFKTKTIVGPHGPVSSGDHIFVNLFTKGSLRGAGAYDYVTELAAGDYAKSRETISDHLPIYIDLGL
jgi:endonuclease/exonuclease/phosphatase family metal-dependent hydrolase